MSDVGDFPNDGFPHFNQRYISQRCCCGTLHCTVAGKRIAIIWLLIFTALLIKTLAEFDSSTLHYAVLGSIFILFLIASSFFVGLKKQYKYLILPLLVFHLVLLITYILMIVLISAIMFNPPNRNILIASDFPAGQEPTTIQHTPKLQVKWTGFIIAACLLEGLTYWWFDIIRRCYRYIRDVKAFREMSAQEVSIPLQSKETLA